jgi:ATP/ADP translocase
MPADPRLSTRRVVALAAVTAAIAIAQLVMAKAVRDALFLSAFSAHALPFAMIGSAGLAFAVVLALSRAMTRWTPDRTVPGLFALNAAMFAAEWALARFAHEAAAAVLYLHTAAVGAASISAFWSLVNERFDPHTAKRSMGRIAAGATLGGVLGGTAAWQLTATFSLPGMLPVLAGLNLVGAASARRIAGAEPGKRRDSDEMRSGFAVLRDTPYLRQLALLVALAALGEAMIDYVFKVSAAAAYTDPGRLAGFFALFHTAVGLVTFGLQATLARPSLERLGLATTVGFMPGLQIAAGLAALAVPGLPTMTALRGGAAALESSLFRSGYELLYTPLPPGKKRPTKALVDVGADKLGGALGSGCTLLAVVLAPALSTRALLALAVCASGAGVALSIALHRGYVRALADSLRAGAIDLDEQSLMDATTRRTFADTMALDRDKLLAEIAARRAQQARAPGAEPTPGLDSLGVAIQELASHDADRIQRALRSASPLPPALVAHVIPLLARDDVLPAVVSALREVAPRATGQLVDALLDPQTEFVVRRRLPRVIRAAANQRAAEGLLEGLHDERFEVRYRCGVSLLKIAARDAELYVDREAVLAAARDEIARGLESGRPKLLDEPDDDAHPFRADATARALSRTVSHVFTILALILDREPLQLAYRALASDDPRLRGTGLEYLDNVLPEPLLDALRPVLGDRRVTGARPRQREQIVEELLASRDALVVDPSALRDRDTDD